MFDPAMQYYNVNATVVGVLAYSALDAATIVRRAVDRIGIDAVTTAQPTNALPTNQLQLFERTA